MSEYSKLARGSFLAGAVAKVIPLPFVPDYVEVVNQTNAVNSATQAQLNVMGSWYQGMPQNSGVYYQTVSGSNTLQANFATSNGISTFSGGLSLQYASRVSVVSITKGSPAVVVATSHGLASGDIVIFEGLFQSPTTGMPQICGMPFVVTVSDANTFSIPWNTNQSNYTALSASPTGAYVKKVIYPFLYAPGISIVSSITEAATTTITLTAPHNLAVGDQIALRIPPLWGAFQLNSSQNPPSPGSPVYGYVQSVVNSTSVILSLNSSAASAFNSNPTVASVPGLSFPQLVAVGDINNGGIPYAGGNLYPAPMINGLSTVNGPAVNGAFVNNSGQGIIIGTTFTSPTATDVYWRAVLHDYVYVS